MKWKWYMGVDGGGSKTDFALSSPDGETAAVLRRGGCSYLVLGMDAVVMLLADGVRDCLMMAGVDASDCGGCCIGLPCYGENPSQDQILSETLQKALSPIPLILLNDVEVGWAGALECFAGIHLVAGTGAIGFGRAEDGRAVRCGGWNEFFGDEGSCYWIGRQAMSLFSKQADGRMPRSELYKIVCRELNLSNDYQFIPVVLRDWAPHRDKVALFQRLAQQAAEEGDAAAAALYSDAAGELALLVKALLERLRLPEGTVVSYSGGLFKTGKLVLTPLQSAVEALGCVLQAPRRSAVEGAVMLAIEDANRRI